MIIVIYYFFSSLLCNTDAHLQCYPAIQFIPPIASTINLERLQNFNKFITVSGGSQADMATQIAEVSTVLAPDAYLFISDDGTYGGPDGGGMQALIEYAWTFNPYKNELWVTTKAKDVTICLDDTKPDQLQVNVVSEFHFYPSPIQPLDSGVVLIAQLNHTIHSQPGSAIISWIHWDGDRQNDMRIAKAFKSPLEACQKIMATCTGPNQVYPSVWDCIDFMYTLPTFRCDVLFYSKGNSYVCRYVNLLLAAYRPEVYCVNTGPNAPGCNDDQCNGAFISSSSGYCSAEKSIAIGESE